MNAFETAVSFLPERLKRSLMRINGVAKDAVQEIRLRCNGALAVSMPRGILTVDAFGMLSDRPSLKTVYCTADDIEKAFLKLCEYSVHSHAEQLKEGFITAKGGFRVGVAGTAVLENGRVVAVRNVRSLCIRIARQHIGCAVSFAPLFADRIPSLLIAGEPSSGKTSVLKDIARMLSVGECGRRSRVCVVDERGEIAGDGGLEDADVLSGIPKHIGIMQAIRTMAPDVVISDELGTMEEVAAVAETLRVGVPTITTVHCRNMEELCCRPAVRMAVERRLFDKVVFLRGRACPGCVREVLEVDAIEMDRGVVGDIGRDMLRCDSDYETTQTVEAVVSDGCVVTRF